MKKSPIGVDTIELTKRYRQHKADLTHIINSVSMDIKERCSKLRVTKIHFHKSLNKSELNFINTIEQKELTHE